MVEIKTGSSCVIEKGDEQQMHAGIVFKLYMCNVNFELAIGCYLFEGYIPCF